jgi:hypothetical protein
VAADLWRHLAENPWARYALVFPPLFVRCALRDGSAERARGGTLLIAAGLAMELAAVFAGAVRWARPGPVLAALGMCRREGVGSERTRLLLFFAIPLPAFVMKLGEGAAAMAMGKAAIALFGGSDWTLLGWQVRAGGETLLEMSPAWLPLAPLLAGLAWYDAVLQRRALPAALVTCAAAAALALPVHTLGLGAALTLASWGERGLAEALVNDGVWLGVTAIGVALAEWRLRGAAWSAA